MNKLETLKDIVADKYDGCYEVMRECVMAYANVDTGILDFNDLDLVLMIPIGTRTVSTDKKVALVKASHLEDDSKVKLISKMEEVDKKAKNGDVSALTEYAKMLEKAQSIGNKLERAKGDLTANQSARFLKIQQKLLNAASDL